MNVKRDILWRVYVCFLLMAAIGVVIACKAFYIQQVQGNYWVNMSDSLHEKIEEMQAGRGTIYSEDGQMLSTSIPRFDVYIDFGADGLRQRNGKRFRENVDSLSYDLSQLFKDKSAAEYKRELVNGYNEASRYFTFKKKVSFRDYQALRKMPLIRLGRNKSGFIAEVSNIRLNPYNILAYRTIGLNRENSQKVGLEGTYDTVLKGLNGRRLVRYIAGGVGVPVDEQNEIDPQNGKDIVTTIDTHIQDITEAALMNEMVGNEAQTGCAIVMEVATGKVRAIANLGRQSDGSYWENYNYALTPTEPGSTFKLATMISLLDAGKITLNTPVDLGGGEWVVNGRTVYDSESHGKGRYSAKEAFEMSSNVGMAKLVYENFKDRPNQFVDHLKTLQLNKLTGVDVAGERSPKIYSPGDKIWSATTLPWMAFGYSLTISPLRTTMLYNAVANNGKMMQPYLVEAVSQNGIVEKTFEPKEVMSQICKPTTLKAVQSALYGVCNSPEGTARSLMKDVPFKVAGKTGTALVADGKNGYANKVYQASFVGYFPADHPKYTVSVIIVNKPHAAKYYGASVAGPVFKEIAERLYTLYVENDSSVNNPEINIAKDTAAVKYVGYDKDLSTVFAGLNLKNPLLQDSRGWSWGALANSKPSISNLPIVSNKMPQLDGMGLKDALYLCESMGLKVNAIGSGKVMAQSIPMGTIVAKGQVVDLKLN